MFKRAIQQRQSVVDPDFYTRNRGAKLSTFKMPQINRKRSTSRYSTTTIWEMSVSPDRKSLSPPNIEVTTVDENFDRKQSMDRNQNSGTTTKEPGEYSDDKTKREEETADTSKFGTDETGNTFHKDDDDDAEEDESSLNSVENIVPDSSAKLFGGIEDGYLLKSCESKGVHKDMNDTPAVSMKTGVWEADDTENEHRPNYEPQKAVIENAGDKWRKVGKVVRFVRPVHKPVNLENVTCKVPKGKSDPKDCLSKDPVYVGWAKIVGHRLKTKTIKRKDGEEQTVTIRQGRSLPANLLQPTAPCDVSEYLRRVSNKVPPHQLGLKRLSIDMTI